MTLLSRQSSRKLKQFTRYASERPGPDNTTLAALFTVKELKVQDNFLALNRQMNSASAAAPAYADACSELGLDPLPCQLYRHSVEPMAYRIIAPRKSGNLRNDTFSAIPNLESPENQTRSDVGLSDVHEEIAPGGQLAAGGG
ncbi:hypothetical protein PHISP_00069 [Aspergillus sp. HF37]|nr:hypothetical protein PHISP_00069 [Aspergillus sp. HF37]